MAKTSDEIRHRLEILIANKAPKKQIVAERGRLIRQLKKEYKDSNFTAEKSSIKNEVQVLLEIQHEALKERLNEAKKDSNIVLQTLKEVIIKARKIQNEANQIKVADTGSQRLASGAKIAGNVVSSAVSVAKAPVVVSLKLISLAVPIITTIAVQPLHVPAALFSKIIKPDSKYNGRMINSVGKEIGKLINTGSKEVADAVRSL